MLNQHIHKNYKLAYYFYNSAKTYGTVQYKVHTSNVFNIQKRFYHLCQKLENQLYFSSSKLSPRFSIHNQNNSCIQIRYLSFSWLEGLAVTQSKYFQYLSQSEVVLKTMDTLQYVHDKTHLPWWLSIVITTVVLRTALTLPLAVFQNYIIAKIENLRPKMDELIKVLKKETDIAVRMYKWDEKYARMMYNRSAHKLWKDLIIKENCHPFKTTVLVFIQIPMWIILSAALRNMATMMPHFDTQAQLLHLELSHGGFGWLPNLIEVDHSLILPVAMCICNILIVDINTAHRRKTGNTRLKYLPLFFKSVSIVLLPIAANVPGCLVLYWATSSCYGLVQNLLLIQPRVRRAFGIPQTPSESKTPNRDLKESLKKTYLFMKEK